jgi:hypothetical protein
MFKVYEIVKITIAKNSDQEMVKLVASVASKFKLKS